MHIVYLTARLAVRVAGQFCINDKLTQEHSLGSQLWKDLFKLLCPMDG